MTNSIGQVVGGRYRIESVVAKGGMATVYLAHDLRLERDVALKIIHPHLAGDVTFREKFIREAKIAAKLSNPNLVNVFDQGEDGDIAFLAMEYISGITLRDALKDFGALDAKRALELFEPVVSGLAAAHRAGILHRDLKPENIFLADDGRIKLGDFGLARAINNHTSTGSLVGTVAYLSPELVLRGVADARSDVYAAGIILFEMLTGRQPFVGEQAVQIAYQHANENVPAPSKFNPAVPPLLDELVLWATAREASHRPADAAELLAVVQRARADLKAGRNSANLAKTSVFATQKIDLDATARIDRTAQMNQAEFFDQNATTVLSAESLLDGTQVLDDFDFARSEDSALEKMGKRKRGLKLVISTILVVLLGSGAGWWFGAGPGGFSAIPNLTSRTLSEAQSALAALNANILVADESSATVTKGLVTRTNPSGGSWFFGGTITIYVSTGAKLVSPPNLLGKDLATATAEILKGGFTLGEVNSYFNQAPIGQVFDYLGSDGSEIPEASNINLSISLGAIP
ncbi:MAG: Stk1 family PASTA domain-containing Ser/Thr kinase, partial [Rhodoluna sp.]